MLMVESHYTYITPAKVISIYQYYIRCVLFPRHAEFIIPRARIPRNSDNGIFLNLIILLFLCRLTYK